MPAVGTCSAAAGSMDRVLSAIMLLYYSNRRSTSPGINEFFGRSGANCPHRQCRAFLHPPWSGLDSICGHTAAHAACTGAHCCYSVDIKARSRGNNMVLRISGRHRLLRFPACGHCCKPVTRVSGQSGLNTYSPGNSRSADRYILHVVCAGAGQCAPYHAPYGHCPSNICYRSILTSKISPTFIAFRPLSPPPLALFALLGWSFSGPGPDSEGVDAICRRPPPELKCRNIMDRLSQQTRSLHSWG